MPEFINTIDLLGDDAVMDSIIDRSITEFKDNVVTTVGTYVFSRCAALKTVDCPSVTSVAASAFEDCTALEDVNLPALTAVGSYMFRRCKGLKSISLPGVTGTTGYLAFETCTSLESVDMPNATEVGVYSFQGCVALTKADFPSAKKICAGGLQGVNLETLILRYNGVATLDNTNAFSGKMSNGTGYIYVPKAQVDRYKAGTNWSTYANQIRAIEDYPDITGG